MRFSWTKDCYSYWEKQNWWLAGSLCQTCNLSVSHYFVDAHVCGGMTQMAVASWSDQKPWLNGNIHHILRSMCSTGIIQKAPSEEGGRYYRYDTRASWALLRGSAIFVCPWWNAQQGPEFKKSSKVLNFEVWPGKVALHDGCELKL